MASSDKGESIGDRLLALCREVFQGRHYEAAHHLLNSAIHVAHDLGDEQALIAIEKLAKEQAAWINTYAPESIMSSQSAKAREGVDMYAVTIRQAAAHQLMIRENRRRQASRLDWPDDQSRS
jgi:hypothetical protein